MEFEASFTLKEIKEHLRRKKYKFVVNHVAKILEKEEELPYASQQFIFMIIYYQSTAVNKLLERNLMKKYKYHSTLVESLLQLLVQNIAQCHRIVSEEIRSNSIFQAKQSSSDASLGLQKQSLQDHFLAQCRRKSSNSAQLNSGEDQLQSIRRHMQLFLRLVNNSFVFMMKTIDVYCGETGISDSIADFIRIMSKLKFTKIADFLSQIKIKLDYGKSLSLSSRKEQICKSEKIIEEVTQNLLDILHMINITTSKLSKSRRDFKIKKYEEVQKECFKLIIIAIVISNKNNMKLGKEGVATLGIEIFRITLQSLTPKFYGFRKLMLPQLYLQEQFLKYRAQKQELAQIISLYFSEKAEQIEESNKQRLLSSSNKILDFYNKQHNPCVVRTSNKPRTTCSEINTTKSIGSLTVRKRGTAMALRVVGQEGGRSESKGNILTKMIINEIDQINSSYLKFKAINNAQMHKPSLIQKRKSSFYKIESSQILKKQRVSQNKRAEAGSQTIDLSARKERFEQDERQFQKVVSGSKQRLIGKNKQKVLHMIQNPVQDQEGFVGQVRDIEEGQKFIRDYMYPSQKVIEIQEKDLKKSMLAISAKKRTEMFLQILIQNREVLGIKKIAEKLQFLRKKEHEKLKMLSNRLTSSINRNNFSMLHVEHEKSHFNKFEGIAKEIVKKHNSFQTYRIDLASRAFHDSQNRTKLIEANYTLGQKSIDTIKLKLQSKMNKGEKVVDKYHKNEEVFKLKLKRLGTTNFILKKTQEDVNNVESSLCNH